MVVYSPIDAKFVYKFRGVVTNHSVKRFSIMSCEKKNYNSNDALKKGLYTPFVPETRFGNRIGVKHGEIKGMVAYREVEIIKCTYDHPMIPYILQLGFEGDIRRLISVYNQSYHTHSPVSICYINKNGCCTDEYTIVNSSDETEENFTIVPYYKEIIKKLVHNFTCGDFSPLSGETPVVPIPYFLDFSNANVWEQYREFLKNGFDNVEINLLRQLFEVRDSEKQVIENQNVREKIFTPRKEVIVENNRASKILVKETYSAEYLINLKNSSREE